MNLTWDDFWAFYRKETTREKRAGRDILAQINLQDLIGNASPKVQLEILKDAPIDVVRGLKGLSGQTMKYFGLSRETDWMKTLLS